MPDHLFFKPVSNVSCSPCLSSTIIVCATVIVRRGRMAMLKLVLLLACLLPLVTADYNCSKPMSVIDPYTFDFLRTFGKAAREVKSNTFERPDHMMNFTLSSKDTRRNVTIWSTCSTNNTAQSCSGCLGILFTNIYELCCQRRSSSGGINLRTQCSIGYSAPDYVVPGWTDLADLPQEVQMEPKPIDFDAAHNIFRTHNLYSISLPALLFNTLFGMY